MRQIKLFSVHTDNADDAARNLAAQLKVWKAQNTSTVETEGATTSVATAYDPDLSETIVVAILTVVYRGTETAPGQFRSSELPGDPGPHGMDPEGL